MRKILAVLIAGAMILYLVACLQTNHQTIRENGICESENNVSLYKIDIVESDISNNQTIYRTPYGKRYHDDPDCGGKNSYEITMEKALDAGLTPCKRCIE